MPNYYHILLQTPEANLSRSICHLSGIYIQTYNKMHRYDGQLFCGRYKSILVDAASYFLEFLKYIRKNPLKAGRVKKIDDYPWSSHNAYLSNKKIYDLLNKEFVFSILNKDKRKQKNEYKKLMSEDTTDKVINIFESKKLPSVIGSENFVEWVKNKFYNLDLSKEIIENKSLAPVKEEIVQVLCKYLNLQKRHV